MVDGVLPHHDVMLYGAGLVSHLREIHATKNCFMDVCPDNIIIIPSTEKGQLIDFGLVHEFSGSKLDGICPPRLLYASPELLSPPPYRVIALLFGLFFGLFMRYGMGQLLVLNTLIGQQIQSFGHELWL